MVHSIMNVQSGNFRFLEPHDVQLVRLGALAERYFHDDPNTCLIKLRQFGELLAQLIAAKTGLYEAGDESQADLLRRLRFERVLPPQVVDLFHTLRILGNNAAHGAAGTLSEALNALKYARQAGVWFHRTFGRDPSFVAGPFQPPAAPEDARAILLLIYVLLVAILTGFGIFTLRQGLAAAPSQSLPIAKPVAPSKPMISPEKPISPVCVPSAKIQCPKGAP